MARRQRLDAELVRRGLARSRTQAQELVTRGQVRVAGMVASKPATQVEVGDPIVVSELEHQLAYASRGGHKLAGALAAFEPAGLRVAGRRCLDAGASTGGFTDVLLRAGAASVVAVDVGTGLLDWRLRQDPRVEVRDRTNVRELDAQTWTGERPSLVVADLSFISLALVLPALVDVADADADFVLMVKPQFEVGRERVGPGGVVREPALREEAVATIAARAHALGLGVRGVTASPLPGPAGNVEYFLWLAAGAPVLDPDELHRAIEEGPT